MFIVALPIMILGTSFLLEEDHNHNHCHAKDPPLLLLDEPTSGMDTLTEEMIFKAFRAVGANRTIITISHRLSGVIDADEVYIMASGRIVQSGNPEKLAGEKGWYKVFRQLEELGWRYDG